MKLKQRILWLCITALLCLNLHISVSAEPEPDAKILSESLLQQQLSESGVKTVQEWIDSTLCEGAGGFSEWYIIALAQSSGHYDFSAYERVMLDDPEIFKFKNSAAGQKYALTLAAIGSGNLFIRYVLDGSVGNQGIMTWIYGLQLLNNGYTSARYTAEEVTAHLLSARLPDGGWAITGTVSDVDVTAMALQALAPYREREDVSEPIGNALAFLSQQQLPDGDFAGFGSANAESTAQVLITLCSLQIDPFTDAAFLKNGNSVLHGLLKYRLEDGSFCHITGNGYDRTATEQTFLALTALQRYDQGKSNLYQFDLAAPEKLQEYPATDSENPSSPDTPSGVPLNPGAETADGKLPATFLISVLLAAVGTAVCLIFFFLLKKRRAGDYLTVLAVTALAILLTCTIRIQSPETHDNELSDKGTAIGTVTITIRCDTVAGKSDAAPASGIILEPVTLTVGDKDSVLSLLREAAQANHIPVDSTSGYVREIGSLREFGFGDLSGWVYRVNGKILTVGSRDYRPKDGDAIEWLYTCELGKDIS